MERAILMTEPGNAIFDPADFLAKAGLGRRIVKLSQSTSSFRKEIGRTLFSIFRRAEPRSP